MCTLPILHLFSKLTCHKNIFEDVRIMCTHLLTVTYLQICNAFHTVVLFCLHGEYGYEGQSIIVCKLTLVYSTGSSANLSDGVQ
jgi:hypothetical protein